MAAKGRCGSDRLDRSRRLDNETGLGRDGVSVIMRLSADEPTRGPLVGCAVKLFPRCVARVRRQLNAMRVRPLSGVVVIVRGERMRMRHRSLQKARQDANDRYCRKRPHLS